MSRRARGAARHITRWQRQTARLVVMLASDEPPLELVREAYSLQRQCERLAEGFQHVGRRRRR